MIWTSYYAGSKKIEDKSRLVSIACFPPRRVGMAQYKALAPTPEILRNYKDTSNKVKYVIDYNHQVLGRLSPAEVAADLDGKILCCYEKAGDFCHRHLVAQWLRRNGIKCEELKL